MTDRIKGFTVTLERDMRDDDVQPLAEAIGRLRGVAGVDGLVADTADHIARVRIAAELRRKLFKALEDETP